MGGHVQGHDEGPAEAKQEVSSGQRSDLVKRWFREMDLDAPVAGQSTMSPRYGEIASGWAPR